MKQNFLSNKSSSDTLRGVLLATQHKDSFVRMLVARNSQGNVSLQHGAYVTEADKQEARGRLHDYSFID